MIISEPTHRKRDLNISKIVMLQNHMCNPSMELNSEIFDFIYIMRVNSEGSDETGTVQPSLFTYVMKTLFTCAASPGWMDELAFYVPSTVFQSFRDDGRVNMKGSVQ